MVAIKNRDDVPSETASGTEKKSYGSDNLKMNPWKVTSIILGVAVVVLLIFVFRGGMTGNVISESSASQKIVNFAQSQGISLEVVKVSDAGSLYEVTYSINGKEAAAYLTKDGKNFIPASAIMPITGNAVDNSNTNTQPTKEVPKSSKPVVEAFIFSYCPYGLQFEKALLPVYDLLKNKADINIVAIGAMHGEFEKTESLRQISIEQIYGRDKLFAYLKEFNNNANIGSCSGDDTCLNKYLPAIYSKLGIDKTKVENYMKTSAEKIYNEQGARASSLGISGSPTFVINGVESQVSRTPDAIKTAVCSAFSTAPSECSQTLSTASPSPGFGASASSSGSAASCG